MLVSRIKGLYAIADATYLPSSEMGRAAEALLRGGAGVLQLRAKAIGAGEMLGAARLLREITLEYNALFIVNDRVDVALLSRADGAHLGQNDLPLDAARKLLGPDAVIGISTHDVAEAEAAKKGGADYVSFGPIFPTSTKMDAHSPQGLERLKELCRLSALPVVAIGGITSKNAGDVIERGAASVAFISEVLLAPDIEKKTREMVSIMNHPATSCRVSKSPLT